MIDYSKWCAIRDGVERHLTPAQIANELRLDIKTVRGWIGRPYEPRRTPKRPSQLDPFKGRIIRWLEARPLNAQGIFKRLREEGFPGGFTSVKKYVRTIRARLGGAFDAFAWMLAVLQKKINPTSPTRHIQAS